MPTFRRNKLSPSSGLKMGRVGTVVMCLTCVWGESGLNPGLGHSIEAIDSIVFLSVG
jgi:hypothetical protein